MRILDHLDMYALPEPTTAQDEDGLSQGPPSTILCSKGFWIYTKTGGILEVYPGVNSIIRKGDTIARVKNIFGNLVDEVSAPCGGIVSGGV
jgi:predicted deacylase